MRHWGRSASDSRPWLAKKRAKCSAGKRRAVSSEADQIAYLEWLMGQSDDLDMELVTWWSNRDLIPAQISDSCDCTAEDQGWCDAVDVFSDVFGEFNGDIIFKYWGTMGLRTYEGDEKPALMERWRALRSG